MLILRQIRSLILFLDNKNKGFVFTLVNLFIHYES